MTMLTFPVASSDGHYRRDNFSIAPTVDEAEKVNIDTDEIRGVITCNATAHTLPKLTQPEWRHTRAVVMKNGDMHIVALASAVKDGLPGPIGVLDAYPRLDESAMTRIAATREALRTRPAHAANTRFLPA